MYVCRYVYVYIYISSPFSNATTPSLSPQPYSVSRLTVHVVIFSQREQAPRSRQPCSSCRRRGGRLRCARFVSATNGYEIVADTRIAVTLVDLVIK